MSKNKKINIVISGVGGQGLITLGNILARAAFLEGKDIKMSELHGLSQRGGSVAVQIRFGKKIYSPLISVQEADLVIAMERNEALKSCLFGDKAKTIFLINDNSIFSPAFGDKKLDSFEVIKNKILPFAKKIYSINATDITTEKFDMPVLAGIYMLGCAISKGFIPLKPENVLKAIEDIVPRGIEDNKKAFNLAKQSLI
ncbi:2-oxoacid:acceptor oxidoreductase family protein [Patescibacteria group bacterium]|nr:2-oxoacid:acceptor oxidoreductase family protein [Patescibacteria group bacterium]MBU4023208.1 2-oxoacid:acceptor oxidoreductase family protein [Patescibacteria group bacterium]MBU4078240.1 2-oxoacid:acceptor oxidoreductase family protein [Patescibacteria group bacterium]